MVGVGSLRSRIRGGEWRGGEGTDEEAFSPW